MAKRSLAATVRRLERKIARRKAIEAKRKAKEQLKAKAASLRKQLRGY